MDKEERQCYFTVCMQRKAATVHTCMYVCRPGAEPGSTYLSSNQVRVVHLHVVGSTVVVVVALVP